MILLHDNMNLCKNKQTINPHKSEFLASLFGDTGFSALFSAVRVACMSRIAVVALVVVLVIAVDRAPMSVK